MVIRWISACLLLFVIAASVISAADLMVFQKVDYFEVVTKNNGDQDEKKRDARLEIDQELQELRVVHEKKGASEATYAQVLFADVNDILYERSKSPRVKTAIFL